MIMRKNGMIFFAVMASLYGLTETNAYLSDLPVALNRLPIRPSDLSLVNNKKVKGCGSTTFVNDNSKQTRLSIAVPSDDGSGLSYGERSRPYRRDVFDSDEWVRVRNKPRFSKVLSMIFQSGIIRQLLNEAIIIAGVATFICVYNALLVVGYDDFNGIHHDPYGEGFPIFKLPGIFFTLTSPALSLLLVFKTNTSYQRWDEGRKNWGAIVNSSRTIMREGSAWIHQADVEPDEKQRLICRLAGAVWCFPRSMTRHLLSPTEDEAAYAADCRSNLRPELAEDLVGARHRPTRALYELSCAINALPLSAWRRVEIDHAANVLCDAMGSNERIFTSPVPRVYTRHTSRFLEVWLLLLPLTLYDAFSESWNHWAMVPAAIIITFFLTGIEELGLQLEEPFGVLPMHKISNGIGLSAEEHVQWMTNDIERRVVESKKEVIASMN